MSDITFIPGGVTAASGFSAAGDHLGIRRNHARKDVALIVSGEPATAAACYTRNLVKGAPLTVTKAHIADGCAQAIICNSGNANTCNANGVEIAEGMSALVEKYTGVKAADVIVASTGVIGQPMSLEPFTNGVEKLAAQLAATPEGGTAAAQAIMTTDTVAKEVAVTFTMDGKPCTLGGISKGSGMICPNMATMLCFLTTDASMEAEALQAALSTVVADTFNMLSVDGDTSTNDMVCILANGMAGNTLVEAPEGEDYQTFCKALQMVCEKLCQIMAKDGEGATRLLTCAVSGAKDQQTAKTVAKAVIKSNLLKAAIFGADANWGRVLCAIGYSGADVDVNAVDVDFISAKGILPVCRSGAGVAFSEEEAKVILSEDEITVKVVFHAGSGCAKAWGCDLTYDYVKINGDYRT